LAAKASEPPSEKTSATKVPTSSPLPQVFGRASSAAKSKDTPTLLPAKNSLSVDWESEPLIPSVILAAKASEPASVPASSSMPPFFGRASSAAKSKHTVIAKRNQPPQKKKKKKKRKLNLEITKRKAAMRM
jgi:hypothetical protein